MDCNGKVLTPLNEGEIPSLVKSLSTRNIESVAINLLFSFQYPAHEQQIVTALRETGFFVSASSEILPEFREYERASTTAINAYVTPILNRYIGNLESALRETSTDFRIMQSNGGSIRASQARTEAVRSILSGPAGGVVGALYTAQAAGFNNVITFDMGGTSTDVSLSEGEIQVTTEAEVGGLPLRIPVVDIHTVGAGGGSIAHIDAGGALRVGPQSAGADPGPVCYDRGGCEPTVTDANVALGRLAPEHFLDGNMELDVGAATDAMEKLSGHAGLIPSPGLTHAQTAALGVIEVANAHMQRALRVISVERGFDPRDFTLGSFGGAGGLHACNLARELGMQQVFVPRGASTLSAFGMLTADVIKDYVQTVMLPGDSSYEELERLAAQMVKRGQREVQAEGVPRNLTTIKRDLDMRYRGQSYEISVPMTPNFIQEFHNAHDKVYGHSDAAAQVEIVNVRLRAIGAIVPPSLPKSNVGPSNPAAALLEYKRVVVTHALVKIPFFLGGKLRPGHAITGPAMIVQPDTTIFLSEGDSVTVDEHFNLVIRIALS